MDEEAKLRLTVRRGEEALALLENELFKQAFRAVEEEILNKARSCEPQDRDVFYRELAALKTVNDKITKYAQSGNHAKKSLLQKLQETVNGSARKEQHRNLR